MSYQTDLEDILDELSKMGVVVESFACDPRPPPRYTRPVAAASRVGVVHDTGIELRATVVNDAKDDTEVEIDPVAYDPDADAYVLIPSLSVVSWCARFKTESEGAASTDEAATIAEYQDMCGHAQWAMLRKPTGRIASLHAVVECTSGGLLVVDPMRYTLRSGEGYLSRADAAPNYYDQTRIP